MKEDCTLTLSVLLCELPIEDEVSIVRGFYQFMLNVLGKFLKTKIKELFEEKSTIKFKGKK